MRSRDNTTDSPPALSLRATLTIATLFWIYSCLAVVLRLELTRQGLSGKGPSIGVLTTCCLLLYPVLCALTYLSWRAGYDSARWARLVLVNFVLACVFGATSRPAYVLASALHRDQTIAEANERINGKDFTKAVKLWGSSFVEDAALYLMLQAMLFGASAFVRLKDESAARDRLAHEFDRARLQALRMQTNPHFLFNTLTAIAGLINARPAAAQSMVTQLGELFRATLEERDAELVSLQRELELGRQYLEIQRTRFDSRFDYSFMIQPEAEQAAIPPLLLQPLLENAAEHGLTTQEGSVLVEVDATCASDEVHIVVRNRASVGKPRKRGSHRGLGLELVRERVRAAFGPMAGLQTELTDDGTFLARLTFPQREVPVIA
ncbi:MAG TPA: histidine kinase [Steroidobacteraceae bacterium]|nr:histidine kinase [Steroidobacteraceae bacterium]